MTSNLLRELSKPRLPNFEASFGLSNPNPNVALSAYLSKEPEDKTYHFAGELEDVFFQSRRPVENRNQRPAAGEPYARAPLQGWSNKETSSYSISERILEANTFIDGLRKNNSVQEQEANLDHLVKDMDQRIDRLKEDRLLVPHGDRGAIDQAIAKLQNEKDNIRKQLDPNYKIVSGIEEMVSLMRQSIQQQQQQQITPLSTPSSSVLSTPSSSVASTPRGSLSSASLSGFFPSSGSSTSLPSSSLSSSLSSSPFLTPRGSLTSSSLPPVPSSLVSPDVSSAVSSRGVSPALSRRSSVASSADDSLSALVQRALGIQPSPVATPSPSPTPSDDLLEEKKETPYPQFDQFMAEKVVLSDAGAIRSEPVLIRNWITRLGQYSVDENVPREEVIDAIKFLMDRATVGTLAGQSTMTPSNREIFYDELVSSLATLITNGVISLEDLKNGEVLDRHLFAKVEDIVYKEVGISTETMNFLQSVDITKQDALSRLSQQIKKIPIDDRRGTQDITGLKKAMVEASIYQDLYNTDTIELFENHLTLRGGKLSNAEKEYRQHILLMIAKNYRRDEDSQILKEIFNIKTSGDYNKLKRKIRFI